MLSIKRNTDIGLLILRVSISGMMLLHGISKLLKGIGFIEAMVVEAGMPSCVAYGVYVGEVIVPILMILGIATRLSSVVFAINCLVAIFLVHAEDVLKLTSTGGWGIELLGLYLFASITLIFTGGGKYALSKKYIWD